MLGGRQSDGSAEPGQPGSVATHIARAAARLFASRGYDATSVREIVEAAGVTKPTLYYYFRSKEALGQALVHDALSRLSDEMLARLRAESGPVAGLAAMIQVKLDFCVEDPDRARFFYALFFGPLATGLAAEIAPICERMDAVFAEGVRRVVEAGIVPADRAESFTAALNGMIVISTVEFLYRGRELGPGVARRIVDDLLGGFGVPGTWE
jgi:AcrR family transcriptional regulator